MTINKQEIGVWMPVELLFGNNFISGEAFKMFVRKLKIEVQNLPRTKRMK